MSQDSVEVAARSLRISQPDMDSAKSTGKADSVVEIFPNGDVILVVGPQAIRLKVQSLFIRSASKVFSAMLGPDWSEGQGLSRGGSREIILVEDDAEALRIICCVIHHRNDDVPQTLTPEQVLQIAIAADKYNLTVALRYAIAQWLKYSDIPKMADMGYLMVSALLFSDRDAFANNTLALVLYYTSPYLELFEDEKISQFIPYKMICKHQPLPRLE